MSDGSARGKTWDVFVSFAAPDRSYAEDLAELLEEQGLEVFVSTQAIEDGESWMKELFEAVRGSKVVAVLLSERSDKAHYQGEEIILAIDLERSNGLRIVPIYVDGRPSGPRSWEFGLRSYQSLDLVELGIAVITDRVMASVNAAMAASALPTVPPSPATAPRSGGDDLGTVGDLLHSAALRIDRRDQWRPVMEMSKTSKSVFFLLHGPRRQNLRLFVYRVTRYLGSECGYPHRFVIVPTKVAFTTPRTAAEWENHLRYGLSKNDHEAYTALDLLEEAVRSQALFLVFGAEPFGRWREAGDGGLGEAEIEAFEAFLGDRLPQLLAGTSEGQHPIRVMVATHYDDEADSLMERFHVRARRALEARGLLYRRLRSVRALEWGDIEDYLDGFEQLPDARIYLELKEAFDRLNADDSLEFREILELLTRMLGET